ncbi:hypothetical protein TNCV_1679101 [Trichonephila clavipes]|nr:hypothetical protein TNCV_1679101 [Trichonephila clavipes]
MQVSPVPASDEVCSPVFSELRAMRCFPGVRSAGCKCLPFLLVMKCARLFFFELLAMRCFGGIPSCEKCWIQVSPVPASDEVCPPDFWNCLL